MPDRRSRGAFPSERRAALLSLTIVIALGACSSSSGGTKDGAPGPGGSSGGDAAGGGPGAGSPAVDASAPYGGGTGGAGGGGGTPSACPDPAFPVSCAGRNDVPASCWSPGTACSTIVKCGDQYRSCTSANAQFDCAQMACVSSSTTDAGAGGSECADPSFPVACPANSEVPMLCWSPGTVCSTVGRCGTELKSCLSAGHRFSCTEQRCVPALDGGAAAPDASVADAAPADGALTDVASPDARGDSD